MVEHRARQNVESALAKNVEFAHALVALSQLPPEKRQEGLLKLAEVAKDILETLKLNVEMFVGPDGKPIESTV